MTPDPKKASQKIGLKAPQKPSSVASGILNGPWASLFFVLLFFLGSADVFFTTRIHGFNFRWGQALLLLAGLPAAYCLFAELRKKSPGGRDHLSFILPWLPFFLIYGSAALFSASPFPTGIKWGWGVFNIGLASLVCLSPIWGNALEKGFHKALILIVSLIWIEALAIYVFTDLSSIQTFGPGMPGAVTFWGLPIGYAQVAFKFMGFQTYRPCSYYYEPSYAGCAITFAYFLLFYSDSKKPSSRSGWLPALAVSAMILTSSRAGILSAFLFLTCVFAASFFHKGSSSLRRSVVKAAVIGALMIGLFCAAPAGNRYLRFLAGPLGTDSTKRLHTRGSSEGDRLSNIKESLRLWAQHPILGNGVTPQAGTNNSQGLSQFSMETWSEIGLESGLLGVLAFSFAIFMNMWRAWKRSFGFDLRTVILTCWIIHFSVQFLLSQTFPRLDYWLIFFLSIRLLLNSSSSSLKTGRKRA